MKVSVLGAGNSGLAMAAHLSREGCRVTLWNRSRKTIESLLKSKRIVSEGIIEGVFEVDLVTDDIQEAVQDPDLILITTPANAHRELAQLIAENIKKSTVIVLNPGRTFGALEFREVYARFNQKYEQVIAETQTIVYTCRKTGPDSVNVIALKADVLLSTFKAGQNSTVIRKLPLSLQQFFIPAKSMVQTSIGNVGMILHSAPLLLNAGWTENEYRTYKYYYDGITPSISRLIEKLDQERLAVSRHLGSEVERTKDWLKRSYGLDGETLFEVIQKNEAYKNIEAPGDLEHRYILEDVPYGLVPLEAIGKKLGLEMKTTSLIIDLASSIMEIDFRKTGRRIQNYDGLL
ncbi:MAG: NAD(P)-binding domain-containing protein [Firmicutes bacterium]|nr:NAD(P)-binding domain-containing protein [Bacillota bacterium]